MLEVMVRGEHRFGLLVDEDIGKSWSSVHFPTPCSADHIQVHSPLLAEQAAKPAIFMRAGPFAIGAFCISLDPLACFLVLYAEVALFPFFLALCQFLLLILGLILLDLVLLSFTHPFLCDGMWSEKKERDSKEQNSYEVFHDLKVTRITQHDPPAHT